MAYSQWHIQHVELFNWMVDECVQLVHPKIIKLSVLHLQYNICPDEVNCKGGICVSYHGFVMKPVQFFCDKFWEGKSINELRWSFVVNSLNFSPGTSLSSERNKVLPCGPHDPMSFRKWVYGFPLCKWYCWCRNGRRWRRCHGSGTLWYLLSWWLCKRNKNQITKLIPVLIY